MFQLFRCESDLATNGRKIFLGLLASDGSEEVFRKIIYPKEETTRRAHARRINAEARAMDYHELTGHR
jgi:hypothetical protein